MIRQSHRHNKAQGSASPPRSRFQELAARRAETSIGSLQPEGSLGLPWHRASGTPRACLATHPPLPSQAADHRRHLPGLLVPRGPARWRLAPREPNRHRSPPEDKVWRVAVFEGPSVHLDGGRHMCPCTRLDAIHRPHVRTLKVSLSAGGWRTLLTRASSVQQSCRLNPERPRI